MVLVLLAREGKLLSLDSHLTAYLSIYNLLQIIFNIKTLFNEQLFISVHFSSASTGNSTVSKEREEVTPKSWTMPGVCKAAFWGTA